MARISPGTMTAAIFAILIGLGGAYAVRQYLHQAPPKEMAVAPAAPELIRVPVASVDLDQGRQLTINDLVVLQYTPEQLKASPYANKQYMRDTRQITGRILQKPLKKGEEFLTTSLYPEGMGPGIAEQLKPNRTAVSVPIQNVAAVAGFARPGSMVDVLFRSHASEEYDEVTLTLIENAVVMAVGTQFRPGHDVTLGTGNVTLSVSPHQAKVLKAVEGRGELTLTLRSVAQVEDEDVPTQAVSHLSNAAATHKSASEKVTLEQLLGLKPKKRIAQVDIYHGGKLSTKEFKVPAQRSQPFNGALLHTPISAEAPDETSADAGDATDDAVRESSVTTAQQDPAGLQQ